MYNECVFLKSGLNYSELLWCIVFSFLVILCSCSTWCTFTHPLVILCLWCVRCTVFVWDHSASGEFLLSLFLGDARLLDRLLCSPTVMQQLWCVPASYECERWHHIGSLHCMFKPDTKVCILQGHLRFLTYFCWPSKYPLRQGPSSVYLSSLSCMASSDVLLPVWCATTAFNICALKLNAVLQSLHDHFSRWIICWA